VFSHPFFWSDSQKLIFLKEASDRFEIEKSTSHIAIAIESQAAFIVGTDWKQVIDARILDNQGKFRKYNYASVRDVLRLIRNKAHHYWDLSEEVRSVIGPPPSQFLQYFEARFPNLFISAYNVVREHCAQEASFSHYFQ
jgi:serine/threonine-protein kinase/endoribonuclease IRE1